MEPSSGGSVRTHSPQGTTLEEAMTHRRVPILEPQSDPELPSDSHRQPRLDESSELFARLQLLWDSRRLLFRAAAWGFVLFTIIAFLIPSKYDSVTQLMPPDNDTSGTAM